MLALLLLAACAVVLAHDTQGTSTSSSGVVDSGFSAQGTDSNVFTLVDPVLPIKIAAGFLIMVTVVLVVAKTPKEGIKRPLFGLIIFVVLLATLYLAGHTVYENVVSESKGPVHWHADYEVLACGQRLDLADPRFPSNKIGSPLFHEHNDDRIHIEGTVTDLHDVDLGSYFEVIGGQLSSTGFSYPVEGRGLRSYQDGDRCPDGSRGTLKVYVNGRRIKNPQEYLIYPHALVPPGDCIIVLFDESASDMTDITCESWLAKGWHYYTYQRPAVRVGDHTWP